MFFSQCTEIRLEEGRGSHECRLAKKSLFIDSNPRKREEGESVGKERERRGEEREGRERKKRGKATASQSLTVAH